ncbi:acyl-CoA N-acyltransferase [Macroventuria anomochaeta]|uniref:Acyl-CoA N-acyltransferase n=1 Tax=Macroventuria anomochaeta TaxID=301207 RepID=A0ACB6RKU5_9PLEO|nr:acyl-CoA N-acyltransferase [Macroventuria anomochaeta]KAF2621942.1 acyl-CoA N-acyltransferase [Macroventuria anomochaeta]
MSFKMEPYNSDWPKQFSQLRTSLLTRLQGIKDITIEHIGITAVPDLPAQPIIDILTIAPLTHIDDISAALVTNGPYECQDDPRFPHCVLLKASHTAPPHIIFLCPTSSLPARAHLAIRDTLLTDADLRAECTSTSTPYRASQPPKEPILQPYRDVNTALLQQLLIASQQFTTAELATLLMSDLSAYWQPISTPRLVLREYELGDVEGLFALESNADNARYQSWHPWTRLEARQNLLRGIQRSYERGRTTIELAVVYEGSFIGRIGAAISSVPRTDQTEEMKHRRPSKHFTLWYSFLPSHQGKGLATEAMRTFVDRLLERHGEKGEHTEMEIECDPRNTGSWKLAERLGFERASLTERAWECKGEWVDSLVYRKIV